MACGLQKVNLLQKRNRYSPSGQDSQSGIAVWFHIQSRYLDRYLFEMTKLNLFGVSKWKTNRMFSVYLLVVDTRVYVAVF